MPITIAICDDEKNVCEEILSLLKEQCADCQADIYPSGGALLAANKEYDIYFLDVQMPGINGIETAAQIRDRQKAGAKRESKIIFITALKEYMEYAFDVKAFHYIVKPIDRTKLNAIFARALADCRKEKDNAEKYIIMKSGSMSHKIFITDIFYAESKGKKVSITGVGGTTEYYTTLQEIESLFGSGFFRCHRCYVVNMDYVKRYNTNAIWLKNGDEILLAKKKYSEFVKAYMAFAKNGGLVGG